MTVSFTFIVNATRAKAIDIEQHELELDLKLWYEQFSDSHESLRDELMERVIPPAPRRSVATRTVTHSLGPIESHTKLQSARFRVSLVASLLVACLGAVLMLSASSRPAYALQDVLGRVRSAQRLYVRGYRRSPVPGAKLSVEFYMERPGTFWQKLSHTVRGEDGKLVVVVATTGSDGRRRYRLRDGTLQSVKKDLAIWSEIEIETRLSGMIGSAVFLGSTEGYEFLGRQQFHDKTCDVYERHLESTESRHRVFVDPKACIPIAAMEITIESTTGIETIVWQVDTIRVDQDSPDHRHLTLVNDSELSRLPATIERFPRSRLHPEGPEVYVPFCFQLGKSKLVCWATRKDEQETATVPTFQCVSPDGLAIPTHVEQLGQTGDGSSIWNWVLLQPPQAASGALVQVAYTFSLETANGKKTRSVMHRLPAIDIGAENVEKVLSEMSASFGTLTLEKIDRGQSLPAL